MQIRELIAYLETLAPPMYQESYDNAGLLTGNAQAEITGVLICLDATEEIMREARIKGCNLVIAHHPIIFGGLKRLTGRNYVERTIIEAIRADIAIYAIHTNLDSMLLHGVNTRFAERLGLKELRILSPKKDQTLIKVWANAREFAALENQLIALDCTGYFNEVQENNGWLDIPVRKDRVRALKDLLAEYFGDQIFEQALENASGTVGAGMIGKLESPMPGPEFLGLVKKQMKADCIRHTRLLERPVRTVALCGGSGQFLLQAAIAEAADVYISADFKYHEFFDADGRILIADIGHYESEQFTIALLYERITEKFSNFAVRLTELNTNPIHYI